MLFWRLGRGGGGGRLGGEGVVGMIFNWMLLVFSLYKDIEGNAMGARKG